LASKENKKIQLQNSGRYTPQGMAAVAAA
jgi:hypothetical protein